MAYIRFDSSQPVTRFGDNQTNSLQMQNVDYMAYNRQQLQYPYSSDQFSLKLPSNVYSAQDRVKKDPLLATIQNSSMQNISYRDDDGLFKLVNPQFNHHLHQNILDHLPIEPSAMQNSPLLNHPVNEEKPANDFECDIQYKTYPKELYKKQKRMKGTSEQRIENGCIEFYLSFPDKETLDLVSMITVDVKRTNEHLGTHKYVGPVQLEPNFQLIGTKQYIVKVDLDSVYRNNDDKKVYELQKTLTKELNLFHLIVTVKLQDGRCCIKNTEGILLIGKKSAGVKRPANIQSTGSISPNDSPMLSPKRSPSSGYVTPASPTSDDELIRVQNIVAEHINTKSATVTGVLYANKQVSPNGDIAYHFEVKDSSIIYHEGEVIGFLAENGDHSPKIVHLTSDNAKDVVLKGVVTRSQYFEARKPKDSTVKTETVCMMGIVPVLVHGSVKANDALYASPDLPGFAVSGCHLSFHEKEDAALVGYAFQSLKMADEDETGMVQAGISVLNSASQILLNRRLRQLNLNWTSKLYKLKRSNKNMRKCMCWSGIVTSVLLCLSAIFLWQTLAPGTAYRYYRCRQGSLKGRTAEYLYPTAHGFDYIRVNGIEFDFDDLMDKTDNDYNRFLKTGARYFLNIDRCAYGGTRKTADENEGLQRVGGPELFVVNSNCSLVYQYFEVINKWTPIEDVSSKHNNLHCDPPLV